MPDQPRCRTVHGADPIPSPCIRNCCLDEHDICLGCFRHVDEIIAWGSADSTQRRHILANADQRRRARR
jgi:predicted Fe-S protein YdhL (DUF1289 family)